MSEWGPWTECSKACDGGIYTRTKEVAIPLKGAGFCESEESPKRFMELPCNPQPCPPNLACSSRLDLMLLLDGSGSVRRKGFRRTRIFARNMIRRIDLGEDRAKVGVIMFSKKITLVSPMTFDKDALVTGINGMKWPRSTTATSKALLTAIEALAAGGRSDVDKDKTIVMVVTDGMPNDSKKTFEMAQKVKEKARLIMVAVGKNLDTDALYSWASFPPEQNVVFGTSYDTVALQVGEFLADLCQSMYCKETYDQPSMRDYIGCQTQTVGGITCQKWTSQTPNAHKYKKKKNGMMPPSMLRGNLVGNHNYCRNPDGKEGGIWCYTTTGEQEWDYCEPRAANATGWNWNPL